jgi:predicted DNA binding CopG/RHH family protein
MMSEELNIVKKTAKELGMTYRQLGEAVGYSEDAIKQAASSGNISQPMAKALELLEQNITLKAEKEELQTLKTLLKNFIG